MFPFQNTSYSGATPVVTDVGLVQVMNRNVWDCCARRNVPDVGLFCVDSRSLLADMDIPDVG